MSGGGYSQQVKFEAGLDICGLCGFRPVAGSGLPDQLQTAQCAASIGEFDPVARRHLRQPVPFDGKTGMGMRGAGRGTILRIYPNAGGFRHFTVRVAFRLPS